MIFLAFIGLIGTCFAGCSSDETETITGIIYADNWFRFWFNGELIMEDPVEFIPHNAVEVSFEAPVCGKRTFAIQAQDYSDDITGKHLITFLFQ